MIVSNNSEGKVMPINFKTNIGGNICISDKLYKELSTPEGMQLFKNALTNTLNEHFKIIVTRLVNKAEDILAPEVDYE